MKLSTHLYTRQKHELGQGQAPGEQLGACRAGKSASSEGQIIAGGSRGTEGREQRTMRKNRSHKEILHGIWQKKKKTTQNQELIDFEFQF